MVSKTATKRKARSTKAKPKTEAEKQKDKNDEGGGLFKDPAEILTFIKTKEGDLNALRDRMEDDYDIYRLKEFEAKPGYKSFTSTAPKNFFDKILDGVNRAALNIQVRTDESDDSSEDAREAANEAELFLIGILNDIDRRNRRRRKKALRNSIAFMSCLRGWVAMRAIVHVPKGKENTEFDVVMWDPMHTYWEDGEDGFVWAAHQRKASKAQIRKKYGIEIDGKDATITDWWDETNNLILVDDVFVKAPKDGAHGLDHVPVWIGNVGDMPDLQTKDFTGDGGTANTLKQQGESVFTTAKGIIAPRNEYVSHLMDIAERSRSGSLLHYSKDGQKSIEGDPFRTYQEIKLSTAQDEKIVPLELPQAPPEVGAVLGALDHDWQQSTLPYPLAYGGTQAAESGRALAIRIEATRSAYSPRTTLLREAYQWLCEELLEQFANPARGAKEVDLDGVNPKMDGDEAFFRVRKGPDDIQPDWVVEVSVEPRLPRDEETEINMSIAATRGGPSGEQPLVAMRTARTDILHLRNPDREEQKVLIEMGQTLPPIMNRRIAEAMKNSGDEETAALIMEYTQAMELETREKLAAANEQVPPEEKAPVEETPAAGTPEKQEMDAVITAVMEVLVEAGREDLGQAFGQMLDSKQVDPALLEEIFKTLMEMGEQELAEALAQLFGATQQPPAG